MREIQEQQGKRGHQGMTARGDLQAGGPTLASTSWCASRGSTCLTCEMAQDAQPKRLRGRRSAGVISNNDRRLRVFPKV